MAKSPKPQTAEMQKFYDCVPDENEIRERLAQALQDATFLRALLRVAIKRPAARVRQQKPCQPCAVEKVIASLVTA